MICRSILIILTTQAETPLGYKYSVETTTPHVALVPVLRSGLGMLEGTHTLSPQSLARALVLIKFPQRFRHCCPNPSQSTI